MHAYGPVAHVAPGGLYDAIVIVGLVGIFVNVITVGSLSLSLSLWRSS